MADNGIDAALFTRITASTITGLHVLLLRSPLRPGRGPIRTSPPRSAPASTAASRGGGPGGATSPTPTGRRTTIFHAVRRLTKGGVKRLGIEFDHVNIDTLNLLKSEFPERRVRRHRRPGRCGLRMIKSAEEIAHITEMAASPMSAARPASRRPRSARPSTRWRCTSTATMVREIAGSWPHGELMDTWTWFQSASNTDGAHNPVTSRDRARRHPVAQLLPDGRGLLRRAGAHAVRRDRDRRAHPAVEHQLRSTTAARSCWCRATAAATSPRN